MAKRRKKDDVTREDYTPEPTVDGNPIGDNFAKPGDANKTGIEGETEGLNGESQLTNAPDAVDPVDTPEPAVDPVDPADPDDEGDADDVEDTDESETNPDSSTEGTNDDEADDEEADESGEPDPNARIEESWEHRYETAKANGETLPEDTGGESNEQR